MSDPTPVSVLLVERDEQPHELAANRRGSQDLWQLGQVQQPVCIPRCPIGIIAVDDPIDEVMGLAGLVEQCGNSCGTVVHGDLV